MNIIWLLFAGLVGAHVSSEVDSSPEDPWGKPVGGLACRLELPRVAEFDSLQDLTVDIWLKNVSEEPVRVCFEKDEDRRWLWPLLFDLTLGGDFEADAHPRWEVISIGGLSNRALVVQLAPGQVYRRQLPLSDWIGSRSIVLAPGHYTIAATYRGLPAELRNLRHRPDLANPWRGSVTSTVRSFRISNSEEENPSWSEAVDGVRASLTMRPRGSRFILGEKIQPIFRAENGNEDSIRLERRLTWQTADHLRVLDESGARVPFVGMRVSGFHPFIRWEVPPGASVLFYGPRLNLQEAKRAKSWKSGFEGPAGLYSLEYTLRLYEKQVWFGGEEMDLSAIWSAEIGVPRMPIELVRRD